LVNAHLRSSVSREPKKLADVPQHLGGAAFLLVPAGSETIVYIEQPSERLRQRSDSTVRAPVAGSEPLEIRRFYAGTAREAPMLRLLEKFGAEGAFHPEDVSILVAASDDAWREIERSGVRFGSDDQREFARNT
jgi:hypothetical protein